MKSQVPIDQLLIWAFRDGHPFSHDQRQAMRSMYDAAAFKYGTVIDQAWTARIPDYIDDRDPDAKIIQTAVFELCASYETLDPSRKPPKDKYDERGRRIEPSSPLPLRRINWYTDSVGLLGSLAYRLTDQEITHHGAVQADCGALYDAPLVNPGALVLQYAICGGFPRWNFGERLVEKQVKKGAMPQLRLVCDNGFGKQVDISPVEIARARFEYRVWYESIRDLAPKVPEMKDHEAIHPNADVSPWNIKKPGSPYQALILENFSTSQKEPLRNDGGLTYG